MDEIVNESSPRCAHRSNLRLKMALIGAIRLHNNAKRQVQTHFVPFKANTNELNAIQYFLFDTANDERNNLFPIDCGRAAHVNDKL